jgi:STE24 endopeptidase
VAAAALVGVATVIVPWDWVPGGTLVPVPAAQAFTAAQIERAESYSSAVRLLSWASYAVSLAVALLFGLTHLGASLASRLGGRTPWWLSVPLTVLALLLVGRLVTLPFGLAVRRRSLDAGLTNQSLAAWFADRGLSLAVSWVVVSVLMLLVVGLARRSPGWWFVPAGAAAVVLTFVGSFVYPVLVEPLFNHFTPMAAGPFKESVLALAEREGIHVDDVLVADASRRTTTLNAYVSGFGGSRRVVVYDNLVEGVPPAEARSVIAHELGHAEHHDVVLGTTLGALGALLGVCLLAVLLDSAPLRHRAGVGGAADPRSVALALALVGLGMFLASPGQNIVSRAVEARADRTAIAVTHDDAAFEAVQRRLALRSLADPTPPAWSQFWFGSHPTVLQRLGLPASMERAER